MAQRTARSRQTSRFPYRGSVLSRYRAPHIEGLLLFTGGFVGYRMGVMSVMPNRRFDFRGAWDDFDLMLFDKVIGHDHLKQENRSSSI